MKKFILFLTVVGLLSCSSPILYHQIGTQYPQTIEVDIYLTDLPAQAYKEIGLIEVRDRSCDVEKEAVKRAKKVGANGIVLVTPATDISNIPDKFKIRLTPAALQNSEGFFFIAIRYLE